MSGLYLRPLDPADPHGLLAPSPGGGNVPMRWRLKTGEWTETPPTNASPEPPFDHHRWIGALVLRTIDGIVDPLGMGRAREVLARVSGMDPSGGVAFRPASGGGRWWRLTNWDGREKDYPRAPGSLPTVDDTPEALAAILAHLGVCEVVRG